jgi:hypothetical protein
VFHVPIDPSLTTIIPWSPYSWLTPTIMLGGTLLLLFSIAEFTERRKLFWRALFETIFAGIGRFGHRAPA